MNQKFLLFLAILSILQNNVVASQAGTATTSPELQEITNENVTKKYQTLSEKHTKLVQDSIQVLNQNSLLQEKINQDQQKLADLEQKTEAYFQNMQTQHEQALAQQRQQHEQAIQEQQREYEEKLQRLQAALKAKEIELIDQQAFSAIKRNEDLKLLMAHQTQHQEELQALKKQHVKELAQRPVPPAMRLLQQSQQDYSDIFQKNVQQQAQLAELEGLKYKHAQQLAEQQLKITELEKNQRITWTQHWQNFTQSLRNLHQRFIQQMSQLHKRWFQPKIK